MSNSKIEIHDVTTGEIVRRDLTEAELATAQADKTVEDARAQAEADVKAANDAKVLSAKNKLKALGLTDAEVTALVG
tara:strand:+ start:868 stop:1098 length:231 start_codon:yes stop_codon:yes gene_type:complete